jgi:serine/threonine protein kinase
MKGNELMAVLQSALGDSYALERELAGGGMSRVFVAEETTLGRRVVIKVLSPELAGRLSTERFTREVRLAETMLDLMGTPPDHKRQVVVDAGHCPPGDVYTREALAWLDKYLGPVR